MDKLKVQSYENWTKNWGAILIFHLTTELLSNSSG